MENMNQSDRDLLVRVETNVINISKELSELKGLLSSYDMRIRHMEILEPTVETNKKEIEKLRASGNWKDFFLALGTVIVGVLTLLSK